MHITRIGVDLAKQVFQLHGVDRSGKMVSSHFDHTLGRHVVGQQVTDNYKVYSLSLKPCSFKKHYE
jgi:transposase